MNKGANKKGKLPVNQKSKVAASQQKTFQEQERDVYQDYQKRKQLVRQRILESIPNGRTVSDRDQRQVEFLDQVQEKIYKNMIAIDPGSFKELVAMDEPQLCFQCAVISLKTLMKGDYIGELNWEEFQHSIVGHEIEFLGQIYGFQQLTLDGVFTRTNIMRAKHELLKYILDANISQWTGDNERSKFNQRYAIQIQNMVQLAENIIGFVEVFDQVVQSFALEGMKFNPKKHQSSEESNKPPQLLDDIPHVPTHSLQHSPKPSTSEKKVTKRDNIRSPKMQPTPKKPQPKPVELNQQLKSEIEEIHALLANPAPQVESRQRIVSQLDAEIVDEAPKVEFKQMPKPKVYQTPQRQSKNSESESRLNKLSPTKGSGSSYTEESNGDLYPNDANYIRLKEAIQLNQEKIKAYVKEQNELKWKIEKETKSLERNIERLQEYDDLQRSNQWRLNSLQAKTEQERRDREYKQELKEFQKPKQQEDKDQELQANLKRFHQILRNK